MRVVSKSLLFCLTFVSLIILVTSCNSKTAQEIERDSGREQVDEINFGPSPGDG